MAVPQTETLLQVWETSCGEHPIHRALGLLDAAWPRAGVEGWASVPIGQRDAWLLDLHHSLFGPELATVTHCPRCRERLEISFSAEEVGLPTPAPPAEPAAFRLSAHGYEVDYRLLNSDDLLVAASARTPKDAVDRLLDRCVLAAYLRGRPVAATDLPEGVLLDLAEGVQAQDPGVEIRVALACEDCGYDWKIDFDPVQHVSAQLDDWAQRLLAEVHALASAYGWAERDIVAMPPLRRQIYLDMVRR